MDEQLLKNTCFHEINVARIPDNTDITRIVSLNGNHATMHTRVADTGAPASTEAFDPVITDRARLFLITSYNEAGDDNDDNDESDTERDEEGNEKAVANATGQQKSEEEAAVNENVDVKDQEKLLNEFAKETGMDSAELSEAKNYFSNVNLIHFFTEHKTKEQIKMLVADKKAATNVKAGGIDLGGGKRTRRRKNHGSKRRNASNKRGRRASKQSRGRGKKQSKRHGRK